MCAGFIIDVRIQRACTTAGHMYCVESRLVGEKAMQWALDNGWVMGQAGWGTGGMENGWGGRRK